MKVAIVDYGMGNLFSVHRACIQVGLDAFLTHDPTSVISADGVILPGVGAFGDAMDALNSRGLGEAIQDSSSKRKPILGICLGLQLLMNESHEFGRHKGLGIVSGDVIRFDKPHDGERRLKVPQVGWNRISPPAGQGWKTPILDGVIPGAYQYFVHSFYARPSDRSLVVAESQYGQITFCAAICRDNVFACQFHPERSGPVGLKIYRNFAAAVAAQTRR